MSSQPKIGDVWRARKVPGYTSDYAGRWGRGRLVEVLSVDDEGVTYRYITGNLAGGRHTMPPARFHTTYEKAGRIDDE